MKATGLKQGISPMVATVIIIVVVIAAAGVLYWLTSRPKLQPGQVYRQVTPEEAKRIAPNYDM